MAAGESTSASPPLLGKTALVTGASRGVGASVAKQLAAAGADVGINYRSKAQRAQQVAAEIVALKRRVLLLPGDITNTADIDSMFERIQSEWERLDVLVLNASGGLEKDKDTGYAMRLNMTAQVELARRALRLMLAGSCIVFVTSHLAHFYGAKPIYESYEPVAASKKAGEDALREMIPEFTRAAVRFVVVSGDLIEGTITPKLLQRQSPGLIESRRQQAGSLPGVEEFAAAIVGGVVDESYSGGATIYVGSVE